MNLIKIKEACLGGSRDGYINPDHIVYISAGDEPNTTVIEATSRNIFLEVNVEDFMGGLKDMDYIDIGEIR